VSFDVMFIVLFAALLHAAWNAFIKSGDNKLVETTLLVTGAGAIAGVALPFLPAPAQPSSGTWRASTSWSAARSGRRPSASRT